jgi:subtilisin-like proprotein convertase family protein
LPKPAPRAVNLSFSREALGDAAGSTNGWQFDFLGNPVGASIKLDSSIPFFVDPTPFDNSEYIPSGHPAHFNAVGGGAVGAWDLLSVVVHEVGHALGFGKVYDRFDSRLTNGSQEGTYVYHGENVTANLANAGHVADDYDLMGYPGFMSSERALPSPLDLAILNDAFDYRDNWIFKQNSGPQVIPDRAASRFSFSVNDNLSITDVDVAVQIQHTYDSDLDLRLISPNGTTVNLSLANGGPGDDYGTTSLWTRFDDEAIAFPIEGYGAPFPGSYRPEQALASLDGQSTLGTWTLEIADVATGDSGTLNGFTLIFTGTPVSLPGDYNLNGVVDAADYILWRKNLGQTGTGLVADGNGNLEVEADDYIIWSSHFGQTASSGTAVLGNKPLLTTVPEPTSGVLIALGLATCTYSRPRRTGTARRNHHLSDAISRKNLTQPIGSRNFYPTWVPLALYLHAPMTSRGESYSSAI